MSRRRETALRIGMLAVMVLAVFAAVRGKNRQQEPITAAAFKLNTIVKISLYDSQDQELLQEALALCDSYEKIFSRTREDSELYRLNHGLLPQEEGAWLLSDPCAELIARGLFYSELSEGAFDISIEPLSSLWDFTSGEQTVPDARELAAARNRVNYKDVVLEGNRLRFEKEGMGLELGAIAKGYVADRIAEFLVSRGVRSAVIDLGGNVLCVGSQPGGKPFAIGIRRPFADRNETAATVEVTDKSVVSSGIYERFFEKDGNFYHHILNPADGYPYGNGLVSVTIISDRSVDGDGLSTACFALGLERGMELVNHLPGVQAVFITEDGALHFSENFEQEIKIISDEG